MSRYEIAFVGTGADPDEPDASGFAMAYHHAEAYQRLNECDLVACADIVPENAAAFAKRFGILDERTYEDLETMLVESDPDVVSVCVPPSVHADVVVDCAVNEDLDAIHCEKPMDLT